MIFFFNTTHVHFLRSTEVETPLTKEIKEGSCTRLFKQGPQRMAYASLPMQHTYHLSRCYRKPNIRETSNNANFRGKKSFVEQRKSTAPSNQVRIK